MIDDLYSYISAIFEKQQYFAGIAVPSAVSLVLLEVTKRIKSYIGHKAQLYARDVRWAIAITTLFFIGFLTWRDEHKDLAEAQGKYQQLASKNAMLSYGASNLSVDAPEALIDQDRYKWRIKISNKGTVPAYIYGQEINLTIQDNGIFDNNIPSIMDTMERYVLHKELAPNSDVELLPTYWQGYDYSAKDAAGNPIETQEIYQEIMGGTKYLLVHIVAIYKDQALESEKQVRVLRFCALFSKDLYQRKVCPGQNRTTVSTIASNQSERP